MGWSSLVVFPAYAGMSPITGNLGADPDGFPRLRGDEPLAALIPDSHAEFSPPTRG